MKRSRPTDTETPHAWTAAGRNQPISRTAYRQDVTTTAPKPPFERRDFLEGIIDKALAASTLSNSPVSPGRSIKPLPPGLTPLPIPKGPNSSFLDNGELVQRNSECQHPIISAAYNTFDEFSASAMPQQSSHISPHISSDKDSFDRVKAEIDEILSPVSECGDRATNNGFPPFPNVNPILQVPPLATAPAAVRPSQVNREHTGINGRGRAMQDLLRAMAGPTKRSSNGRRLMTTSSTQCHMCGKTYTESSNLSKHIRTVHLKLRPFRCHLCTSSFAEKNKLGKHIQSVHEHARPYKCDLCSASFSQASDRKRHRLVLHEGCRPFVCEHCGKAFGRRSSLTQHCQRVHKTNLKPKPVQPPVVLQPPVGMPSPTVAPPAMFVPPQLSLAPPPN